MASRGREWTNGPARWVAGGFLAGLGLLALGWSVWGRVPVTPAEVVAPKAVAIEPQPSNKPVSTSGKPPSRAAAPETKVNLNTAGLPELELLPEIGPTLARAILSYRDTHGPFKTVSELGNVKGIGPRKLAKLIDRVCVEDSVPAQADKPTDRNQN